MFVIFADIHANLCAFEAVLEDYKHSILGAGSALSEHTLISLGDCIGYGPEPEECVQLMRKCRGLGVMGNHEQGLLGRDYANHFNQHARDSLLQTSLLLSEESKQWCTSLPKSRAIGDARFVHGMPPSSVDSYLWKYKKELDKFFKLYAEYVCFVGHTHELDRFEYSKGSVTEFALEAGCIVLDETKRHLINVGSVGQPRDIDNRAKYVIYDPQSRRLEARFVYYDVQKTVDQIYARGMHAGFAKRLLAK